MRVLFLTHRLPYAPNRGDRARAFHIVEQIRSRMDLEIVSLVHDDREEAGLEVMRERGIHVTACRVPYWRNRLRALAALPGSSTLTHVLLDSPAMRDTLEEIVRERRPDVVLAFCSSMARFAMEPPLDGIPLVVDLVDVDSVKWAQLAESAKQPLGWIYRREARLLSEYERRIVDRARQTVVVNAREAWALAAISPSPKIAVVLLGVDLASVVSPNPPVAAPRLVFCGVMNYPPNVAGIRWFVQEVWPIVRAARPDAEFIVLGAEPVRELHALAARSAGVTVTGTVPEVKPYLWNAAVSVAPLHLARGTQNKVLEAIASGLPAVVTSQVLAGLPPEAYSACRVADERQAFADRVLELLALTPEQRRAIVDSADLHELTWEQQLRPLLRMLRDAARKI